MELPAVLRGPVGIIGDFGEVARFGDTGEVTLPALTLVCISKSLSRDDLRHVLCTNHWGQ